MKNIYIMIMSVVWGIFAGLSDNYELFTVVLLAMIAGALLFKD
jgi:hypothetical protein